MLAISETRHQIVTDAHVCQLIHGQGLLAGSADAVKTSSYSKRVPKSENRKAPEQRREHRDLTSEGGACGKTRGLTNSCSGATPWVCGQRGAYIVTSKMFKTQSACGGFGAGEKAE